jgi:hypothetical protein
MMKNQMMNTKNLNREKDLTKTTKRKEHTVGVIMLAALAATMLFMTTVLDQESFAKSGNNVGYPDPEDPNPPKCIVCGKVFKGHEAIVHPENIQFGAPSG